MVFKKVSLYFLGSFVVFHCSCFPFGFHALLVLKYIFAESSDVTTQNARKKSKKSFKNVST